MQRPKLASDKAILKKVTQHLAKMSFGASSRITAVVADGQVTLFGSIQHDSQRCPALKAAASVEGVRVVLDRLQIPIRMVYGK